MMRSVRIFKLLLAAAFIGFLGCATQAADTGYTTKPPAQGDEPKTLNLEDVTFKFDKNGNLVPVTVNGKPFVTCDTKVGSDRTCRLFKLKGQVLDVEDTSITVIKHHHSPDCLYVQSRRKGAGVTSEACL